MKYHWVDLLRNNNNQNIQLTIPQQVTESNESTVNHSHHQNNTESAFQPIVLNNNNNDNNELSSMTKQQVIDYCSAHFQHLNQSDQQALAIGSCVVTNYQDTYQEITSEVK